jgi:hypothetical protein
MFAPFGETRTWIVPMTCIRSSINRRACSHTLLPFIGPLLNTRPVLIGLAQLPLNRHACSPGRHCCSSVPAYARGRELNRQGRRHREADLLDLLGRLDGRRPRAARVGAAGDSGAGSGEPCPE